MGRETEVFLKANYDITSPLAGAYKAEDLAYIANGVVTKQPRAEAKVFAKVKNADDFYVQGWWRTMNL